MNIRFIWLIFLVGVLNLWVADGYKCEYGKGPFELSEYVCKIIPDLGENAEKHISGKTEDDVVFVTFDSSLHNISHLTQSESSPFCQRFKNLERLIIKETKLRSIDEDSFKGCKDIQKIEISSTNIQEFPENLFSENPKLTELWFLAIQLTTLPEKIFASQTELKILSLNSIPFTFLSPNIFNTLTKLLRLELIKVELKMNPKWFKSLKKLIYLDISGNKITDLPKNILSPLKNLELLNLDENQLTVIHSDFIGPHQALEFISLYENKIYAIDEKLINNTNLIDIDMGGNNCSDNKIYKRDELKEALEQCFKNYQPRQEQEQEDLKCKYHGTDDQGYTCEVIPIVQKADKDVKIVKFDKNADSITNLTQSVFPVCERFQNLEEIHIKGASIVDEDFFNFCDDLKVLDIQDSEIEMISIKTNSKLTKLNIQESKLTTLAENMFINQQELVELHLHLNQITSLPANIFTPLKKLRDLWLQGNKIKSLDSKLFEDLSNLATLDLSHNQIAKLPKDVFNSLTSLEKLMLSFNKVTFINSESFGTLQKLTQLDLNENKIDAIDEKLIDNTGISKIDLKGNVCSQDDIEDRDGIKEGLKQCFENYESKFNYECGIPKIKFNGTSYNGAEVQNGEFPWNAVLFINEEFLCGGSLISNKLVVTASYCKEYISEYNFDDFSVVFGAHKLSETTEPGQITVGVKDVHVLPDMDSDPDIAVLELSDTVLFSDFIQPICIAKPDTEPALQTLGYVAGFGGDNSSLTSDVARFIPTPIYSYQNCSQIDDAKYVWNENSFCGGYANGTGVCDSDTGSGLIVEHEGIHYLRGIVSTIITDNNNNCDRNKHSIFTDVLKFYDWINTKRYD